MISQAAESNRTPSVRLVGSHRCAEGVKCTLSVRRLQILEQAPNDTTSTEERNSIVGVGPSEERLLHGVTFDLLETGRCQDRRDVVGVGEPERSGNTDGRCRQFATKGQCAPNGHEPLVVLESLPRHQHEPAARAQALGDVGERGDRVAEEHRAEPAHRDVIAGRLERADLRVGDLEGDVGEVFVPSYLASTRDHDRGQVHAQRRALGRRSGSISGRLSVPASHIEHVFRPRDRCRLHQPRMVRPDAEVVALPVPRPVGALVPVPRCGHVDIRDVHRQDDLVCMEEPSEPGHQAIVLAGSASKTCVRRQSGVQR